MTYCSKCGAEVTERFCPKCGNDCKPTTSEDLKETVNQLYSLRAGISAISMENDIARKDIKNAEENHKNERSKIKDLENENSKLSNEIENCRKKSSGLDGLAKYEIYKKLKKAKMKKKVCSGIVFLSLGIAILSGIFLFVESFASWGLLLCCIVSGFICYLICDCTDFGKTVSEINQGLDEIAKIPDIEREIELNKQRIWASEQNSSGLSRIIYDKRVFYSDIGNAMYDALINQFSFVIDPRDWRHLDLVIFYIETGRAESMKEALQQVDRQIQTDSIVNAIETASREICNTIKMGVRHLHNTIVGCAKVLSLQLENISSQQSQISSQLSSMNNLLTAQSMQNALTAKANVSSKQLMEDVHQMRIYAENAEIKRRNS